MADRATKAETNRRIHRLADLIAKGVTDRKLVLFASETFGVGERRSVQLIAKARELINNDYACERPEYVATRLAVLDQALQRAMQEKRFGVVTQIVRLQCELTGVLGKRATWDP